MHSPIYSLWPKIIHLLTLSRQEIDSALAKAPGTVTSIEFDEEDNTMIYEIELHNGKTEYDFEIHATTGAVLKYEEDLVNN